MLKKCCFIAITLCASALSFSAAPEIYTIKSYFSGQEPKQTLGFAVESEGFLLAAYAPLVDSQTGALSTKITVQSDALETSSAVSIIGVEPTMGFAILKLSSDDELELFARHQERDFIAGDPVTAYALNDEEQLAPIEGVFTQMNTLDCYQQSLTGTMFRAQLAMPASGIGSPVFNAEQQIFAIHTAYQPIDEAHDDSADKGLHLLPISLAMTVYDGVKLRGNLESPWTGFSVRHLHTNEAAQFPLLNGRVKGAIAIEHVWEGSPAEALGIRSGDLLVKLGHYPIESVGTFQKWLYMYGVGQDVKLYFIRQGKLLSMNYTIEARPDWAMPQ